MIEHIECTGTWRAVSVSEGLPEVCIEHVAEDGEGYLWFASLYGRMGDPVGSNSDR